jgi:hypothetical protein
MNGMIGWSGTLSDMSALTVIFWPSAGTLMCWYMDADAKAAPAADAKPAAKADAKPAKTEKKAKKEKKAKAPKASASAAK